MSDTDSNLDFTKIFAEDGEDNERFYDFTQALQ